jgi:MFS family permease
MGRAARSCRASLFLEFRSPHCPFSRQVWFVFYATFVLLGLAGNGTTQLAYSRTVSTWFFARRGVALSVVASGAGVGAMVLPVLAAWLLRTEGWRTTYAVLGLLAIAIGFPLTLLLVRESGYRSIARQSFPELKGLFPFTVSRPFLLPVVAVFLYSVSFNGIISQFSALLTDRGLSLSTSASALSVMALFGLAGRPVTGYLLDSFFAARVSAVLLFTTVAGVLLLSRNSVSCAFLG